MLGRGNFFNANQASPATSPLGPSSTPYGGGANPQNASFYYPFCDDNGQTGNTRCEAGIYVGHSVANDTAGGLVVAGNGSSTPGQYLVQSNSSIAVATATDPARQ